jgi:hypothetical protein
MRGRNAKRWVASVKTDSTHPPEGLFTKDAATVARMNPRVSQDYSRRKGRLLLTLHSGAAHIQMTYDIGPE